MAAYDLLIVGGGVQGLWVARSAVRAGMKVALVEARACGEGASGGLLGALMPHVPTGWSEKKQFQFEALIGLGEVTRRLSDETGIDTGYARCGRAMPIRAQGFLDQFASRRAASWLHWRTVPERFELALLAADALDGWLDPGEAALGVFWDPLAARIDPPRYVAALRASIAARCTIFEGWRFAGYDAATGRAISQSGETLTAARVVLAAGYETFGLVRQLTGLQMGGGVKGQAVLLAGRLPDVRPIIFDDGLYIVSHTADLCAVGSTTEPVWEDAISTDDQIDAKLEQARRLCPPLRDARVIARWAGVRPQSAARDPIAGQLLPDAPLYIASGGFKITLGIAHLVARRLVDGIVAGRVPDGIPETFQPARHVAAASAPAGSSHQERRRHE